MSQQELGRVEVVALRGAGTIKQAEAVRRLGLTVRQVRRLEAKWRCRVRRDCAPRVAADRAIIG